MRLRRYLAAAALCAAACAESAFAQDAPGTTFRDCPQCPDMVIVPAGRFTMGAAPGEEEREGVPQAFRGRSEPRVEIDVPSFALGRHEVTRGQYAAFVAETGHPTGSGCYGQGDDGKWAENAALNWRSPGFPQTDGHPVVCVNWTDAAAYVAWLARKTGKAYRLPSEAEWEYAARAGSQAARPWGASLASACGHANVRDEALQRFWKTKGLEGSNMHDCDDGYAHTAPVGAFAANRFGLHDMIGNVWEWAQDCWNANLSGIPRSGAARLTGDCSRRVVRGGSWYFGPWDARPAFRDWVDSGFRLNYVGFRVARTR